MNLYNRLAIPMKALSEPSSMIESPPSKRVRQVDVVASHLDESQTRDDMFKVSCLRRDGYRCIFSGFMQIAHWLQLNEPDNIKATHVEVAHIIPFSYASWRTTESRHEAASAWRVLYSCFPGVRRAGLSAETIDCESIGLTMQLECQADFGDFKLAFKPVENENNKYQVKTYRGCSALTRMWSPASGFIELKQADDATDLKLPDRDYLDCHWRITEIFNASGMGEVIDKHFQEWEDLKGTCHELREDGTTNVDRFLRAGLWADVIG
ncbi:Uncharacterized protein PECH_001257 [Penicillium ucsense]|uniref:HNH nuclease domain-containing protein n=1 Tax=Penicillium ucsense TaxID=2839758 RepID=A0A8J8VXQ0_9EURO|nr:Uncharacterized protein PECM_001030 [Penicillium ucsense]KAF7733049.1 Uncharacterized protein PECH_001257 [Penicillium ucsense]